MTGWRLAIAATVLCGCAEPPPSDTSAAAFQRAMDVGSYQLAEQVASAWVGREDRPFSSQTARAQLALIDAKIENGRGGDPATLTLAQGFTGGLAQGRVRDRSALAEALQRLGVVYVERRELERAIATLQEAVAIGREMPRSQRAGLAKTCEQLALAFVLGQRFGEAAQLISEVQRLHREMGAVENEPVQDQFPLALLHRYDGEFTQAETAIEATLETRRHAFGAEHPKTAEAFQLRGEIRFLLGNIAGAGEDFSRHLRTAERSLRAGHPRLALSLRYLALVASARGDVQEARKLLERALPIAQQSLATCHNELTGIKNDLAGIAVFAGRFSQGETLYREALSTRENCLGPNHQLTATVVHNLGNLFFERGDFSEAQRYHERAVRMWTAGLGATHPYVARGIDALADVASAQGNFTRAATLYTQALNARRVLLGPTHPDVAWTLVNLARATANSGNVQAASSHVREALAIYARGGLPQDPDHRARALLLRGALAVRQGQLVGARQMVDEALSVRVKILGQSHPLTAQAKVELAEVDFALGATESATSAALDAERSGREHLRYTIRSLPERQALAYTASRPRGLDLALSVEASRPSGRNSRALDATIRSRGVVLDELAARVRVSSGNPALATLNAAVVSARERFATLMMRTLRGDEPVSPGLVDASRREKEQAEAALAAKSEIARAETVRTELGLDAVRNALPQGSVLVSFVRYQRMVVASPAKAGPQRVPSYAAFVLGPGAPGAEPALIQLGTAEQIDDAVAEWRRVVGRPPQAHGRRDAEDAFRAAGVRLRRALWDRLPTAARHAHRLFIAPDGAINLVNFAALPLASDGFLVDDGPIFHYLATERDLVQTQPAGTGEGILAVGGAAFGSLPPRERSGARLRSECVSGAALRFQDLPGTRAEAEDVIRIWRETRANSVGAQAASMTLLSGDAATEGSVKRAAHGRRVLHFATHGFALGSDCDTTARNTRGVGGLVPQRASPVVADENPLLLSGLAFAGANQASPADSGRDDGILTAEEVAGLDLRGTDWAVLSACDTGIGEIRSGEGVFGLRRAFQVAGVRTVIMSLWSVEDQSTRRWMQLLYEARLRQRVNTAEAVRAATSRLLAERRSSGDSTHPFYWAAFVAAGDWH